MSFIYYSIQLKVELEGTLFKFLFKFVLTLHINTSSMTLMEIPAATVPTKYLQSLIQYIHQCMFAKIFLFIQVNFHEPSNNMSLPMLTLIQFDGYTFACSGAVLQRNFSISTGSFIENHELRQCFHSTFNNTSSENNFRHRIRKTELPL